MYREEREELINNLKYRLDNIKGNKAKDRIKRDKLKREIKELKMTMTTEDFESMMHDRSEIDVGKC